jgi:hypothetical protein
MKINNIEWLSIEGKEAILHITTGNSKARIFCHPCDLKTGDNITNIISSFGESEIVLSAEKVYKLKNLKNDFSHSVSGKVIDREKGLIGVFDLTIDIGLPLAGDIKNGDYVSFICERLYL